jgi:hypothetical protein
VISDFVSDVHRDQTNTLAQHGVSLQTGQNVTNQQRFTAVIRLCAEADRGSQKPLASNNACSVVIVAHLVD